MLCEDLPLVSSVQTATPRKMTIEVAQFRTQGYLLHSARAGGNPDADIERFQRVVAELQLGETLAADANGGWLSHEALRVTRTLHDADIYFEQPCASYAECLSFRQHVQQPIVLDEIVVNIGDILRIDRDHAADVINIKISRVGGLTKARQIRDVCASLGLGVWIQ